MLREQSDEDSFKRQLKTLLFSLLTYLLTYKTKTAQVNLEIKIKSLHWKHSGEIVNDK